MKVTINGEEKKIGERHSVAQLLEELGIGAGRVVVELNRNILSRETHETTILEEGDSLEIVQFVGGG